MLQIKYAVTIYEMTFLELYGLLSYLVVFPCCLWVRL